MFYIIISFISSLCFLFFLDYHFVYNILLNMFNTNINNNFIIIISIIPIILVFINYYKDIISIIKHFILYLLTKKRVYYDKYLFCLYLLIACIPKILINSNYYNIKLNIIIYIFMMIIYYYGKKNYKEVNSIKFKTILLLILINIICSILNIKPLFLDISLLLLLKVKRKDIITFSLLKYLICSLSIINFNITFDYNNIIIYIISILFTIIGSFYSINWFNIYLKKNNYKYYFLLITIILLFLLLYFR